MKGRKIIKFIGDEFIYGGHLLSLGAVSIAFIFPILLELEIKWIGFIIVYLFSQSIYSYNRYKELNKDILTNKERTNYLKKYAKVLPFLILIYLLILFFILFFYGNLEIIFLSLIILLLGFGYSLLFKKVTKFIIGFKNFFVALLWCLLVVFLTFYYSLSFSLPVFLLMLIIFLKRFVITSFCDIKDSKSDRVDDMLTLPTILKRKNFFLLLNFVNFVSIILIILGAVLGLYSNSAYFLALSFLFPFFYINIVFFQKGNINFFSEVLARGEFLLWIIFILIGKMIFYFI